MKNIAYGVYYTFLVLVFLALVIIYATVPLYLAHIYTTWWTLAYAPAVLAFFWVVGDYIREEHDGYR